MKNLLIGATALAAASVAANSAWAADAIVDSSYDWTGMYVGLTAGYGWGDTKPTFVVDTADVNYKGFVGGVESGYNWQSENLVLGIESSASLSDIHGNELGSARPCILVGSACSADVDWFTTSRLRVGYAMDQLLPFVAGGLAVGGVKGTFDTVACACHVDDVTFGWTVGGGLEWAMDDRWSLKAEYLYVNLGKPSIKGISGSVGTDKYDFNVARLAVNYRF